MVSPLKSETNTDLRAIPFLLARGAGKEYTEEDPREFPVQGEYPRVHPDAGTRFLFVRWRHRGTALSHYSFTMETTLPRDEPLFLS
jgi:hypothetical protein